MDHLQLPRNPIRPLLQVPCICEDHEIYDGSGFVEFPTNKGWIPTSTPTKSESDYYDYFQRKKFTLQSLERLFQGWIFFGLLHELFSPFGLYHQTDYIDVHGPDTKVLHTRLLHQKLISWRSAYRSCDDEKQVSLAAHLCYYVQYSYKCLSGLFQGPDYLRFNRTIGISLAVLCETILEICGACYPSLRQLNLTNRRGHFNEYDEKTISLMLRNGWCPFEIQRVQREFATSPSARVYYQHMSKLENEVDHSQCDGDGCKKLQINLASYQPRHIPDNCDCSMLGPAPDDVILCLERDDFPVLDIARSDGDVSPKVVPSRALKETEGYLALSHVWVDGLGNPNAMKLPRCQICRLLDLVQRVERQSLNRSGRSPVVKLFFWCDTLLCPLDSHGKSLAISKLREVYERATCVLVLDRSLESYQDITSSEVGMRLMTSRWSQRLWTYQEAQLAVTLLIQLADTAIDREKIAQSLEPSPDAAVDPIANILRATLGVAIHTRNFPKGELDIFRIDLGVSYRSASVASDEPICLANVLGLDAGEVSRTEPNHRWKVFWNSVLEQCRADASIIFNRRPRLAINGYRWAPRTFRQSLQHKFDSTLESAGGGKARNMELTPHGLRVSFPGWRFRRKQWHPPYMADFFVMSKASLNQNLYVRHLDGRWFFLQPTKQSPIELKDLPEKYRDKDWHVILVDDSLDTAAEYVNGLVTVPEESDDGYRYHRSIAPVHVRSKPTAWNEFLDIAKSQGDILRERWEFSAGQQILALQLVLADCTVLGPNARRTVSNLRRCMAVCLNRLRTRYGEHLDRIETEYPFSVGAIAYMRHGEIRGNFDYTIAKMLMSGYGEVMEAYDSSHQWIVD